MNVQSYENYCERTDSVPSYSMSLLLDMQVIRESTFVVLTPLTFKKELLSHCLSFVLVQVYHGNLCTGLTQGVGKCSADALPSTCHIGHLSIKTHPIEDGTPLDPTEYFVIRYFTLIQTNKISRPDQS